MHQQTRGGQRGGAKTHQQPGPGLAVLKLLVLFVGLVFNNFTILIKHLHVSFTHSKNITLQSLGPVLTVHEEVNVDFTFQLCLLNQRMTWCTAITMSHSPHKRGRPSETFSSMAMSLEQSTQATAALHPIKQPACFNTKTLQSNINTSPCTISKRTRLQSFVFVVLAAAGDIVFLSEPTKDEDSLADKPRHISSH
jgi:hypothetical protein